MLFQLKLQVYCFEFHLVKVLLAHFLRHKQASTRLLDDLSVFCPLIFRFTKALQSVLSLSPPPSISQSPRSATNSIQVNLDNFSQVNFRLLSAFTCFRYQTSNCLAWSSFQLRGSELGQNLKLGPLKSSQIQVSTTIQFQFSFDFRTFR